MRITVAGLWHLGCVTAACCAKHFPVIGLTASSNEAEALQSGRAPLLEPGLDELLQNGLSTGSLAFTNDIDEACRNADLLWVTYDTPVDENDRADVAFVIDRIRECVPALPQGAIVLLSSQLPVGTCRKLEREFAGKYRFACSPENLRLGRAIEIFTRPDRIVAGCRESRTKEQLATLFAPFSSQIEWMSPESAEMTKHAINGFLALSITFMNEIARLCEVTGADAKEVEVGLKTESRIGPNAYLSPGGPFAGGTLARDVVTLNSLSSAHHLRAEVLSAIIRSNDEHGNWAIHHLETSLPPDKTTIVVLLGLTYKPGTNTLRRSPAVDLAMALHRRGYSVRALDPSAPSIPTDLAFIDVKATADDAFTNASAVVVCTPWQEFKTLNWPVLVSRLRHALVIDAARFIAGEVTGLPIRYIAVGISR